MSNYQFGVNQPPHKRWPVAWYNPAILWQSTQQLLSSAAQLRNLDRRELFSDTFQVNDFSTVSTEADFWWDFMSDTGDGGNASYVIARAIQAETLAVADPQQLAPGGQATMQFNRPQVLVLGGDLTYPGASPEEYQYRFVEMWEAARPSEEASAISVLSIPQNHDWFDNLSTFLRYFVRDYRDNFLAANTPQTRSYFATKLPHNWWVLGFDFALVCDLDRTQFEAFQALVETQLTAESNLILLYPEPYWTRTLGDDARQGYPKRYQRLEALLHNKNIKVRMRLAGDYHHYVRESATAGANLTYEDALITCGSGGAFLHPTHTRAVNRTKVMQRAKDESVMTADLRERVCVGSVDSSEAGDQSRVYGERVCYPNQTASRALSWKNLTAFFRPAAMSGLFPEPLTGSLWNKIKTALTTINLPCLVSGNFSFAILLGVFYWLAVYCNSFVFSKSFVADGFLPASLLGHESYWHFLGLWVKALFFSPLALLIHLMLMGLCCAVASEDGIKSVASGFVHGLLHILAAASLYWGLSQFIESSILKGFALTLCGMFVGGFIFGIYFALMAFSGLLSNNAFSSLAHQGFKGFLRFKIDAEGHLHGYMIGADEVPQRWVRLSDDRITRPLWSEAEGEKLLSWEIKDYFQLKK